MWKNSVCYKFSSVSIRARSEDIIYNTLSPKSTELAASQLSGTGDFWKCLHSRQL